MFPIGLHLDLVFKEPSSAVSEPEEVVVHVFIVELAVMNSAYGLGNGHDFSWHDAMEMRLILWVWHGDNWKGINRGVGSGRAGETAPWVQGDFKGRR